jgi:Tol biopolymer transport system component
MRRDAMKKHEGTVLFILAAVLGLAALANGAVLQQTAGELFEKALYVEEGQGDLQKAIGLYQDIVKRFPESREIAAKAQLQIGLCYEKLGLKEAEKAFQKVINDFPEQQETVKKAREKLSLLPGARAALEKAAGEFQVRKVWDAEIDDWFVGSPSPNGRYLTYSSEQSFLSLGVRDLLKGESRLIRPNKSWDEAEESCSSSIFSPDGSQIAYSCQAKGRRHQLRIVNLDGTSMRILHDGRNANNQVPENLIPFGWTSDGKQILTIFSRQDNISGIAFISALDGSIKYEKALSLRLPWGGKMSLSPDGRYIAGTYLPRADSANKDIFLLSIEGGPEATLVEHPADDQLIGWSRDGRQVLFTSDRTGTIGIWAVNISDGKARGTPELVRENVGNIRPLGMTGDGKLYYGIASGSSDVYVAPMDPATGKVLAPPVKGVRKYETFNSAPDWSPDGQFLVCRSSRGKAANESPVLLIRSMRTNEVRELIPKTPRGRLNYYYLRWSPDGRSFLGLGMDENGQVGTLLSVDAQTGEAKVIARSDSGVDGIGGIIAPDWSSDGKHIYFVRIGNEFRRVCRLEVGTGVEKEICRFPKAASGPFWLASSPDGQQLALHAEGKIKILSSDGSKSRELTEAERGTVLAWTAEGKNILFGKHQEGSKDMVELWIVPVSGGEPQKAGLSMPQLFMLRVSPDGKNIAFTASEQPQKSEVWVMENFLPKEE